MFFVREIPCFRMRFQTVMRWTPSILAAWLLLPLHDPSASRRAFFSAISGSHSSIGAGGRYGGDA